MMNPYMGLGNVLLGLNKPRPNPMNNIGNRIAMNMPLLGGIMASLMRRRLAGSKGTGDVVRTAPRTPAKPIVRTNRQAVMPKLQRQVTPRYV